MQELGEQLVKMHLFKKHWPLHSASGWRGREQPPLWKVKDSLEAGWAACLLELLGLEWIIEIPLPHWVPRFGWLSRTSQGPQEWNRRIIYAKLLFPSLLKPKHMFSQHKNLSCPPWGLHSCAWENLSFFHRPSSQEDFYISLLSVDCVVKMIGMVLWFYIVPRPPKQYILMF